MNENENDLFTQCSANIATKQRTNQISCFYDEEMHLEMLLTGTWRVICVAELKDSIESIQSSLCIGIPGMIDACTGRVHGYMGEPINSHRTAERIYRMLSERDLRSDRLLDVCGRHERVYNAEKNPYSKQISITMFGAVSICADTDKSIYWWWWQSPNKETTWTRIRRTRASSQFKRLTEMLTQ